MTRRAGSVRKMDRQTSAVFLVRTQARAARSGRGVEIRPEKPKVGEAKEGYDAARARQGPQCAFAYLFGAHIVGCIIPSKLKSDRKDM